MHHGLQTKVIKEIKPESTTAALLTKYEATFHHIWCLDMGTTFTGVQEGGGAFLIFFSCRKTNVGTSADFMFYIIKLVQATWSTWRLRNTMGGSTTAIAAKCLIHWAGHDFLYIYKGWNPNMSPLVFRLFCLVDTLSSSFRSDRCDELQNKCGRMSQ